MHDKSKDSLLVRPVTKSNYGKLDEAYEVARDFFVVYNEQALGVPEGFQFDGASIPAFAWHFIGTPFRPRFMAAAVVHDWLYLSHQLPRNDTDILFCRMLKEACVSPVRTAIMSKTVKVLGRWFWENKESDQTYIQEMTNRIIERGYQPSIYGLKSCESLKSRTFRKTQTFFTE